MAPVTAKAYTPIEEKGNTQTLPARQVQDFSSICIGDYMLGNKQPQKDFLRDRLEQVKEYNAPIKKEIAECQVQIKEAKKERNALERLFKYCDDPIEKDGLKKQLWAKKSELWSLITSNCKRAWDLQRV